MSLKSNLNINVERNPITLQAASDKGIIYVYLIVSDILFNFLGNAILVAQSKSTLYDSTTITAKTIKVKPLASTGLGKGWFDLEVNCFLFSLDCK
jgi:hypothetical protein